MHIRSDWEDQIAAWNWLLHCLWWWIYHTCNNIQAGLHVKKWKAVSHHFLLSRFFPGRPLLEYERSISMSPALSDVWYWMMFYYNICWLYIMLKKVCTPGFRDASDSKVPPVRHTHFNNTVFVIQLTGLLVQMDRIRMFVSCLPFHSRNS